MKRILLTALLIVTANTVAATNLSIKHIEKLPTPYELITKGKILVKETVKNRVHNYIIAWDKTDDIYRCTIYMDVDAKVQRATCYLAIQATVTAQ